MAKKGLGGKGLEGLLSNNKATVNSSSKNIGNSDSKIENKKEGNSQKSTIENSVLISKIYSNPDQPRKKFDEEAISELADSISEFGILEPIIVSPRDDKFIIVAGERRYRAALELNLKKVPVIIKDLSDEEVAEIAIIENIQREDLTAIEEANAYQNLIYEMGYTQDEVAKKVGKKRATISNSLRLLKLSEEMQDAINQNLLSAGQARAILSVKNKSNQKILFNEIIKDGLSVRACEKRASELNNSSSKKSNPSTKTDNKNSSSSKSPELQEMEQKFMEKLGTKTVISGDFEKGSIRIDYYSMEDLDRLYNLL